ncbi:MAG: PilN domain-containing protein [Candidatus Polarisedimenticolaceae bacterium]|nr:PilN domain-containing protein [Candidatus Polarisedimenticolaceae bacterium]
MQQINLYQPATRRKLEPLGSVAMLIYALLLSVVLGGWYGYELSQFNVVQQEVDRLKKEKEILLANMARLTKNSSPPGKNTQLERRIELIRGNQNLKLKVIRRLKDPGLSNTTGFSIFFDGLSRQSIPNKLWLSDILIEQGGKHLMLKGGAMKASLVPVFLQRLSAEGNFQGMEFHAFNLTRPEDEPWHIDFSVDTRPEKESQPVKRVRIEKVGVDKALERLDEVLKKK